MGRERWEGFSPSLYRWGEADQGSDEGCAVPVWSPDDGRCGFWASGVRARVAQLKQGIKECWFCVRRDTSGLLDSKLKHTYQLT